MRRIPTDRPRTYPLTWIEEGSLFRAKSKRTGISYLCFWVDGSAIRVILRNGWQEGGFMQNCYAYPTLREAKESAQEYDDWSLKKTEVTA